MPRTVKWAKEIVADAERSTHISDWEENFIASMHEKLDEEGDSFELSDKQWAVLERIEQKVYGT
jgi:hypothetical protein